VIGRLRGELLEATGGMVIVDAGGVGYEVLVPESVLVQLPQVGEHVDLRIRQVVREDSLTLYGFLEPFQRRLFDLLTGVKGCGPKIGLSLLGQLGEDTVVAAILSSDARSLSRASGVGAKLAERIVLELKDKMPEEALLRKVDASRAVIGAPRDAQSDELLDALQALGYRRTEVEAAARDAREQADTLEEQIKLALRSLAR
jgi:holliday junction DNA helicase RuvA